MVGEVQQPGDGNKIAFVSRLSAASIAALRSGAEGLWIGTCLGVLLLSTADTLKDMSNIHFTLRRMADIVNTGVNIGITIAIIRAVWDFLVAIRTSNQAAVAAQQSSQQRIRLWLKVLGLLTIVFATKIWLVPSITDSHIQFPTDSSGLTSPPIPKNMLNTDEIAKTVEQLQRETAEQLRETHETQLHGLEPANKD